jgi:hypothetical protein
VKSGVTGRKGWDVRYLLHPIEHRQLKCHDYGLSGMTHVRTQLQNECSRAMRDYVRLIQEGCQLLGEVKEGLIPEIGRDKIFAHRKQEVLAHAAYTRARKQLWSFLNDSTLRSSPYTEGAIER